MGAQTGSSPEGGSSAGSLLKAGRTGKDAKTAVCEPTGEGGVVARIGEGLAKGLFFKVLQAEVCYDCGDWASHSCAICILLFINCSTILKQVDLKTKFKRWAICVGVKAVWSARLVSLDGKGAVN